MPFRIKHEIYSSVLFFFKRKNLKSFKAFLSFASGSLKEGFDTFMNDKVLFT